MSDEGLSAFLSANRLPHRLVSHEERDVHTQSFDIDVAGGKMPAYLARPEGDQPRPAIIVLQEIFGVNTEVKRITDLVANAGYVGVAINYYWRNHPTLNEPYTDEGLKTGLAAAAHISKQTLRADVQAAIDWLNVQAFVEKGKIATWGFCMGGAAAFATATLAGLKAAVSFYGGSIANPFPNDTPALDEAPNIKVPLFLAYGAKDDYIPKEARDKIEAALKNNGKSYELHVYPDVGHAFFRHSSAEMNKQEVADAWQKVQGFLKKNLA